MVLTESQPVSEKALAKAGVSTSSVKPATAPVLASSEPVKASQDKISVANTVDAPVATTTKKSVLLASTKATNTPANESATQTKALTPEVTSTSEETVGGIVVEQVELTPEQLAANAVGRAKKALDANNLNGALQGFTEALRYTPRDEEVRQKLAILYFGKGDTRRAYELLQAGIRLNNDSEALRLGLSKLLVKADQAEAALSPLLHLPNNASKEYLAMRAALSQKAQQETNRARELSKIDRNRARQRTLVARFSYSTRTPTDV